VNALFGMRVGAVQRAHRQSRGDIHQLVKDVTGTRFQRAARREHAAERARRGPGFRKLDFSSPADHHPARAWGAPVVAEKWLALTGCPVVEAYGLTETSPAAT